MEKLIILSFNIKNFKSNYHFLSNQILNESIDICFLTETWLAKEENQIIFEMFGNDFNIVNQNEMSLLNRTKGRPFGGKSWLINKKLKIGSTSFINNDISTIESINDNDVSKLVIIGVHLPFDDNSLERMANFVSDLEIVKSILDEKLDISLFVVGDFNTDLNINKKYSKYLNKYIRINDLKCIDYDFPNINYTYKNGDYYNHIDHVIANELARNLTNQCKIIENAQNMSDHNLI